MQLFEVDEETASLLRAGAAGNGDAAPTEDSEAAVTRRAAALMRLSALAGEAADLVAPARERRIFSLWLNLSHGCNLRCRYCFADGGAYGGKRTQMKRSTARKAVDLLVAQARERAGGRFRIVFFGGEPLVNFPVLEDCVLYAERRFAAEEHGEIHFHLITNGTLIDEPKASFFHEHGISVQVSIDGPAGFNDRLRVFPNGHGSFDAIEKGLDTLRASGISTISSRATVTRWNCDVYELSSFFERSGLRGFHLEPVQADPETGYSLRRSDIEKIVDGYRRLAADLVGSIRRGEATDLGCFSRHVSHLLETRKKHHYCGANFKFLVVTPEGDLYSCHRLIGKGVAQISSIDEALEALDGPGALGATAVEDKRACSGCWAKYLCGGGCYAAGFEKHGTWDDPDETLCEVTRAIAENSLKIGYLLLSESEAADGTGPAV